MKEYTIYYDTDQTVNHSWSTVDRTESGALEQFYHELIESEGPNGSDRDDIHITGIVEVHTSSAMKKLKKMKIRRLNMIELKRNTGELMFEKMDSKLLNEMIYLMHHLEYEHWALCHIQIYHMQGMISMCESLVFVPDMPRGKHMDAYWNARGLTYLSDRLSKIEDATPYE